ncbi:MULTISPECIES: helix-turn-helix domain-containing protein [Enterobacterales]|jgi:orotate phosphoribosyltransferase-like protein|uniref:helix-turn-helix domain-containing protein n=1 Tax=Enterobacterales TaxID=91347 RepID=UPI001C5BEFD1|nr:MULTISPECIES: helix-turn-helix domain-containing protein [Enterobacterales]MBW4245194.1 plasmid replication protein [Enterobacter roggenkampii]MDU1576021.1 helix-turn-helix domain-containing protein [Pantoea sp.]MDU1612130.1 helix-turn-helix domain-containing protein [Enterobacter sp.]MDU1664548.1 helix-turn-helix domain-containing protein [Peptoniphilus harei]
MRLNRNGLTQKQLAEKFNISITTVIKYTAIDREIYEQEAKNRRFKAYELKQKGFKLAEIADALGCSYNAAAGLIKRYKQQDLTA